MYFPKYCKLLELLLKLMKLCAWGAGFRANATGGSQEFGLPSNEAETVEAKDVLYRHVGATDETGRGGVVRCLCPPRAVPFYYHNSVYMK